VTDYQPVTDEICVFEKNPADIHHNANSETWLDSSGYNFMYVLHKKHTDSDCTTHTQQIDFI
jgi:hypothetical protein